MPAVVEQGVERADLLEYLPPEGRIALVADVNFEAVATPLRGLGIKVDTDNPGLGTEPVALHEEGAAFEDARLDEGAPRADEVPKQFGIDAEVVGVFERWVRGLLPRQPQCVRRRRYAVFQVAPPLAIVVSSLPCGADLCLRC